MGLISSNISRLRHDPRALKLPPFLALLCMIGGILWVCLLPLDEYSRRTYQSENALLPGQVHTYFAGSEQNIFRGYRHEVSDVLEGRPLKDEHGQDTNMWAMATDEHRIQRLQELFRGAGIRAASQSYQYESAGKTYKGENVYGIVHGPRADGTESIVLVAPIRNIKDELNVYGVTLLLTLARYFSRWSLWSKDIILVITPDATTGPQAWVDAYHSMHDPAKVADLTLKSGHIQGAVCIDYPLRHTFQNLHVAYDGINGQLPNLDLVNIAIQIGGGQMGMGTSIQNQQEWSDKDDRGKYWVRLRTLVTGMVSQALGHATGAHSVFMPYHIDAVTLTATGNGFEDEMALGRVVESMVRSLNNLLEKLHQSFFFYLLLQTSRFVSIGTYLPSAMAVGAGFTLVAIFAWVRSGYDETGSQQPSGVSGTIVSKPPTTVSASSSDVKAATTASTNKEPVVTMPQWAVLDRRLTLPVSYVAAIQLLSLLPIYFLTHSQAQYLNLVFLSSSVAVLVAPAGLAFTLKPITQQLGNTDVSTPARKTQMHTTLSAISLLILGLDLTVLATLNFSLSMFLGIACGPLAFVGYRTVKTTPSKADTVVNAVSAIAVFVFSPPIVVLGLAALDTFYLRSSISRPGDLLATLESYLETEAFAFNIWKAWGIMVGVWAVWTPAWIVGAMGVIASFGGTPRAPVVLNGKANTAPVPTPKGTIKVKR